MKYETLKKKAIAIQEKINNTRQAINDFKYSPEFEKQEYKRIQKMTDKRNEYLINAEVDHNRHKELWEELKKVGV